MTLDFDKWMMDVVKSCNVNTRGKEKETIASKLVKEKHNQWKWNHNQFKYRQKCKKIYTYNADRAKRNNKW